MKVTVTLILETDGGESEADFVDDEHWLALLDASQWYVTDVTSSAKAVRLDVMG